MPSLNANAVGSKWSILLDKLSEFDQQIAPVGLYGIRDYNSQSSPHPPFKVEWELLLKPVMKGLGCNSAKYSFLKPKAGSFLFQETAPIRYLRVVRLSKIKVRKYGNAYRVDPHQEFEQRWKEIAIDSILNEAWKWRSAQNSLVLMIGFADEATPFSKEINALQATQTFKQRFQPALTKVWDDPHGRGFKVIAALWMVLEKQKK